MNVPFVDLRLQHQSIKAELDPAMDAVMARCDFALGKDVVEFETEFAEYCGVRYGVGVDSGLSALKLALIAYGIGPGDEVILPAHTFTATAAAVSFAGARPVLVDVDRDTFCLDVDQIEAAITPRTRAIIPVHFYGLPAEMDRIMEIAKTHDLFVLEDACQAHGAKYKGRSTGALGHAAAFSFYPTKNLGACGDAGMLLTDDLLIAERVRAMRNCGQREKHVHELAPFNHRLDTLQAAILRVKLRYLDRWVDSRRRVAALYRKRLEYCDVILPAEEQHSKHVYHLYVIRSPQRDRLQTFLKEQGIGSAIHYPLPIHMQPYYYDLGYQEGQFPIAERCCREILSLPMFPEMIDQQVEYVAREVIRFLATAAVFEDA
jgi:dTDP-4-amino-4,6-dideoxygalactose transaminase